MPVTELVEVRQKDCNGKPDPPAGGHAQKQFLTRYQHPNHQGSTTLETNEKGDVITYEEYHPFGTTSYQATNGSITAAAKRYRYTGMERDDETGLEYHNARYYIPWLGRWINCDPIGIGDGVNVYAYCRNNPVGNVDTEGTQTAVWGMKYNPGLFTPNKPNNTLAKELAPTADKLAFSLQTKPVNILTREQKLKIEADKQFAAMQNGLNTQTPKVSQTPQEYLIFLKYENDVKSDNPFIANAAQRRMYHEIHGPNLAVDIYSFFNHVGSFYVPQGVGLGKINPVQTNSSKQSIPYTTSQKGTYKFKLLGYNYQSTKTIQKDGSIDVEHFIFEAGKPQIVGSSTIKDKVLTNVFEVPYHLKNLDISKAMYNEVNKIGFNSIITSFNPKSDNYNAFMKLYDPRNTDYSAAVMSTPAAKAIGSKYYPSKIDVKVIDGKVENVTVEWGLKK